MGIYVLQPSIDETVEELIFTGIDLAASVGGYLGLYLGASIMSLCDVGMGLLKRVA